MIMFEVTEDHLKLLRHAQVGWDSCEFGAPAIDPKRPYGNSYAMGDIARILDPVGAEVEDESDAYMESVWDRFHKVHLETATVLQIALSTGEFRAGRYVKDSPYRDEWQRVED